MSGVFRLIGLSTGIEGFAPNRSGPSIEIVFYHTIKIMVSFGHTAVGVIIGVTAYHYLGQGNLAEGLLITGGAGVISHYIADFIPHGHFFMPHGYKKGLLPVIIFDLALSLIIFLGVLYLRVGFGNIFLYCLFGIGGSQLPDVVDGLIYINVLKAKGLLKLENKFHEGVHWHGKNSKTLILGLKDIWQLFIVLAALLLISKW